MPLQKYIDAGTKLIDKLSVYGVDITFTEKQKVIGSSRNDYTITDVNIGTSKALFTQIDTAVLDESLLNLVDKACIVDNTTPIKKDYKVIANGIEYTIVKIIEINPADYIIGYRLFLKGVK